MTSYDGAPPGLREVPLGSCSAWASTASTRGQTADDGESTRKRSAWRNTLQSCATGRLALASPSPANNQAGHHSLLIINEGRGDAEPFFRVLNKVV